MLLGYLLYGRFTRTRRLQDLLLAEGMVLLAVAGLGVSLLVDQGRAMSSHTVPGGLRDPAAGARCCPGWCVTAHGVHAGEEDWVHLSAPVAMVEGLLARVCMSIDPDSRAPDGPYVLIGSTELTPEETRALGETLVRLAGLEGSATEGVAAPADGVLARSGPAHDADSSIAGGSGKPGGRRPALLPP